MAKAPTPTGIRAFVLPGTDYMPSPSQRPRERLRTGNEEMIGAG